MTMTQGEAVFQAVSEVMKSSGIMDGKDFLEAVALSKSESKQVCDLVFSYFKTGQTTHTKNPNDEQLRKYIPGLVNNWVRKDPRLNGGGKYVAKKPGSRAGSGDESVKAMRALLSITTDPEAKQAIQAELDSRIAELKPTKTINVEALPPTLRKFAQLKAE